MNTEFETPVTTEELDTILGCPDEATSEEEAEAHFLTVVEGGAQAEEESEEPAPEVTLEWPQIAQQAAMQIMQTYQAGDTVEMMMVKTAYFQPFEEAFRALPEEFFQQAGFPIELRDQIPIVDDENCPGIQMIKGSTLEIQWLQRYFGPKEQGGNDLLPRMSEALKQRNSHVRLTIEWLRNRYLDELADEVAPRIEIPRGSELLIARANPGRLR